MEKDILEEPLKRVSPEKLMANLIQKLEDCLKTFNGNRFCLALSGGIDSSILAVLLKKCLQVDFWAVTIGRIGHPDIYFANLLAERIELNHKVSLLSGNRQSEDIYDDLFAAIAQFGFRYSIHADAIDELTGGYWLHRKNVDETTFQDYWQRLTPEHLLPMTSYAQKYNISVGLPYLAAHDLLRRMKMEQRVAFPRGEGKVILRQLGKKIGVPEEIIARGKLGLCDVWDENKS